MKLRIRQTAGATLAGLTLLMALVGVDTISSKYELAGKIIAVMVTACLVALIDFRGPGRHRRGGN